MVPAAHCFSTPLPTHLSAATDRLMADEACYGVLELVGAQAGGQHGGEAASPAGGVRATLVHHSLMQDVAEHGRAQSRRKRTQHPVHVARSDTTRQKHTYS